ncbi:MAG: peptide deformylase [Candidatus Falkowbacteria bacterium]|nr:MAG: peptide deformylase [Candidatus Falkowbacteria bacterium]
MAKQLNILINPHPTLRKKSLEISPEELFSKKMKTLLLDMEETMKKKDGAGLAAPQIGENIRIIVVSDENKTIFLINPKITKKSWARKVEDEGCLSVLNEKGEIIYAPISRHKKINCIYLDEKGNKKTLAAENLLARVIQHEIDHLDGILFIDYLKDFPNNPKAS